MINWSKRHRILTSIAALPVLMFISGAVAAEVGIIGILFLMLSILGLVVFVINGKRSKEANNANKQR